MAAPIDWCGSSDMTGFWKTICIIRARRRRSSGPGFGLRTVPSASTTPLVAASSPTTMRATVVLPEPVSPTMAREPDAGTTKLMSFTA